MGFSSYFLLIVLNVCWYSGVEGGIGPVPNAFIHDISRRNVSVEYASAPSDWLNIPRLLESHGLTKNAILCVTGTFLIYEGFSPDDDAFYGDEAVRLFNGRNACSDTALQNASQIRLASSFDGIFSPSLVIFRAPQYRGHSFPFSRSVFNVEEVLTWKPASLILNGKLGWTVETKSGKRHCLRPVVIARNKFPICMLDRKDATGFQTADWLNIHKGCDNTTKDNDVHVNTCYTFGAGQHHENHTAVVGKNKTEVGGGGGGATTTMLDNCDRNEVFLSLLDLRLNNDFGSDLQLQLPKDKKFAWRTELLDTSFEIVMASCPPDLVAHEYLAMIREMFLFVAEQRVWSKGHSLPKRHSEEVRKLVDESDECLRRIKLNPHDQSQVQFLKENVVGQFFDADVHKNGTVVRKEFKKSEGKDLILETVWLVSNHVAAICHLTFEFQTNFYMDFYLMFQQMYLTPLTKHWNSPGKFQSYYPILLGGYDIKSQYQHLASCVSAAFDMQPTLDVYNRPRPQGHPS